MKEIRKFISRYTAIAVSLTMPLSTGAFCGEVIAKRNIEADSRTEASVDDELGSIVDALNGTGNEEVLYGLSVNVSEIISQLPEDQRAAILSSGVNTGADIEFISDDKGGYSSDGTELNAFLDELMQEGVTSLDASTIDSDYLNLDGSVTPPTAESDGVTPVKAGSGEGVTPVTADSQSEGQNKLSGMLKGIEDLDPVDLEDDGSDEDLQDGVEDDDDNDEYYGDNILDGELVSPSSKSLPGPFTIVRSGEEPQEWTAAGSLNSIYDKDDDPAVLHPQDIYDEEEDDDYDDEYDYSGDDDYEDGSGDYDYEDGSGDYDEQSDVDAGDSDDLDSGHDWTGYGVFSASKVIEAPSALPATMELALGKASMPSDNEFLRVFMPDLGAPEGSDAGTLVTVRIQTARDFAERDEFGIPRDEEGKIVGREFVRYVGVDGDGVLNFTAGEDGLITYPQEKKLYYNTEEQRFYSDEEGTIPLTGIRGFVDLAQLMMDSSSVLSLLDAVDGTAATIEIPAAQVYPKTYIDKNTGKELTREEAEALPEDIVETRDPEGVSWLLWKVTEDDKEYAPSFAEYICGNKDGDILFYTDANGRIYYDLSGRVLYDGKYLFSFDGDDGSDKDNKLITSYGGLGMSVYPGAGETVYYTVDGEAFAMSMYDKGEGAKGRYLCRNVTELISDTAEELVEAGHSGKNYSKLLVDPTVFMLMDANGNICYASDSFEWQFLDYGLDYERLRSLMEAGQLPADVELEEEQTEAVDGTEEQILPEEALQPEPEPQEPEVPEEPEEIDDDVVFKGHGRDEFGSDEEWEDYVNGEFDPDEDYFEEEDDEEEEEEEGYDGPVMLDKLYGEP